MTKGNVLRLLLSFALPLFLGNLLQQLYNLADTSIAGHMLGDNALAQIGATSALYSLITNFAFGMNNGLALTVSRHFGAGEKKRIIRGMWAGNFLYGVWWIIALILTFTVAPAAVRLITGSSNPEVISSAVKYLQISISMLPPMIVLVIVRNVLQGIEKAAMPLICSMLELIIKIIFSIWIVPARGYVAVCICEPITWVICVVLIVIAAWKEMRSYKTE